MTPRLESPALRVISPSSAYSIDRPPYDQGNTQPPKKSGPPFKWHAPHAAIGRGVDSAGNVVVGLVAGSEAGCAAVVAGGGDVVSRASTRTVASHCAGGVRRQHEYGHQAPRTGPGWKPPAMTLAATPDPTAWMAATVLRH